MKNLVQTVTHDRKFSVKASYYVITCPSPPKTCKTLGRAGYYGRPPCLKRHLWVTPSSPESMPLTSILPLKSSHWDIGLGKGFLSGRNMSSKLIYTFKLLLFESHYLLPGLWKYYHHYLLPGLWKYYHGRVAWRSSCVVIKQFNILTMVVVTQICTCDKIT